MGTCSRCVWPSITLVVIVVAVVVYFLFPPYCTNSELQCAPSHSYPVVPTSQPSPRLPEAPRTWETDYRIPNTAHPSFYSIHMSPDMSTGRFTGTVTITTNVTQVADHLLVHIDGLKVSLTRLTTSQGAVVRLRETFEYSPNDFWVMLPEERIQPGMYFLYFEFSGSLTRGIVGFYTTNYTDSATSESRYTDITV